VCHAILRDRSKSIMLRSDGLMRTCGALIQHTNPACRAARQFPHLPSARLLMSLTDFDIPAEEVAFKLDKKRKGAGISNLRPRDVLLFFLFLLAIFFSLPAVIGDPILEVFASTGIYSVIIFIAYLWSKYPYFAALLISAIVIPIIGYEVYNYRKRDLELKFATYIPGYVKPITANDSEEDERRESEEMEYFRNLAKYSVASYDVMKTQKPFKRPSTPPLRAVLSPFRSRIDNLRSKESKDRDNTDYCNIYFDGFIQVPPLSSPKSVLSSMPAASFSPTTEPLSNLSNRNLDITRGVYRVRNQDAYSIDSDLLSDNDNALSSSNLELFCDFSSFFIDNKIIQRQSRGKFLWSNSIEETGSKVSMDNWNNDVVELNKTYVNGNDLFDFNHLKRAPIKDKVNPKLAKAKLKIRAYAKDPIDNAIASTSSVTFEAANNALIHK